MNLQEIQSIAVRLDELYRAHAARLRRPEPWFTSVTLAGPSGAVDQYFIGHERALSERVVEWGHPLAAAVLEVDLGDAVQMPPMFNQERRVLSSRAEVKGQAGELSHVRIRLPEGEFNFVRTEAGLVEASRAGVARRIPAGLDDIIGQLTPAQYKLITANREAPLIIQGRAGSGKTSVGLYRVAWLTQSPDATNAVPVAPGRILVLMFNKPLQLFVKQMMTAAGLDAVRTDTFHGWALTEVGRGYRGQIEICTDRFDGAASAVKLKKQLGVLKVVDAFVARQIAQVGRWLAEKLPVYDPMGQWIAQFQADDAPVVRRLIVLRGKALSARDAATSAGDRARLTEVHRVLSQGVERLIQYKEELFKLLTDRELLRAHLPHATPQEIDGLVSFQTALQIGDKPDAKPGPRIAFEDLAILLRLMHLKHGGLPNKDRDDEVNVYEHVLVDEAQDFGAVELNAIFSAVRSRTGVTIVGDTNQKIVPEADFIGWDALAAELGASGAAVARLEVPHRSTAAIMRLADALVGEQSPATRPGPVPRLSVVTAEALVVRLSERINSHLAENPHAHVAVVCGSPRQVEDMVQQLSARLPGTSVRRGHNHAFVFAPGVTVTNLRQIKGLEFDAVFALEVDDQRYPADEQGRRWLYTLVTRAKEALHLFTTERPATLLQPAMETGLVALDAAEDVPVAVFSAEDDEPF
jgi:DNA helicase-2/ATP-dependent DNA helicase PcrA